MDSRKFILQETAFISIGQVICVGAMVGIFALLGQYNTSVLLGGAVGAVLAILNFFFMAVGASLAADKAANQNTKGGKATIQLSFLLRYVLLFVILFAFAKSGLCNPIALVLPLVFTRLIINLVEFFRKPGESKP